MNDVYSNSSIQILRWSYALRIWLRERESKMDQIVCFVKRIPITSSLHPLPKGLAGHSSVNNRQILFHLEIGRYLLFLRSQLYIDWISHHSHSPFTFCWKTSRSSGELRAESIDARRTHRTSILDKSSFQSLRNLIPKGILSWGSSFPLSQKCTSHEQKNNSLGNPTNFVVSSLLSHFWFIGAVEYLPKLKWMSVISCIHFWSMT